MTRSDSPLRIAVTSYYLPSESKIGAGWASHRLAESLVELGHEVTVFSPCVRPDGATYRHELVPLEGSLRTFRWPWAIRRLPLSRFDALLAQGDDHLVRRGSVPAHIRTLHGSCFDEIRHIPGVKEKVRMALLGLTEVAAAIRTPIVVGVSRASLRYFPRCDIVIPNGVDTALFRPDDEPAAAARPTILFVGTYLRRKRGELLMEVFRREVLPAVPNAQLWMVCDDAPPAPNVEVLGRVSDKELAELYRRASVFCLPSAYEGFGIPYVEALVSGTPVVATPNPGAREVLEEGAVGVLSDDTMLGHDLVRLLQDPERRQELRERGLSRRPLYDRLAVAQRYVDLVRDELEKQAR